MTNRYSDRTRPPLHRLLWRLAVSPVTFVVLGFLWCMDLGLGSLTAYYADPDFSAKMDNLPFRLWLGQEAPRLLPGSLWVYILVALSYLLVLSLLLCTLNWFAKRRKRLRGLGEVLVHLGFLLIFGGFVAGSTLGAREQGIGIVPGETRSLSRAGIALRLEDLRVIRAGDGRPLDTVSRMTMLRGGREIARGEVRLNHPLIHGSIVVYPRDRMRKVTGAVISVEGRGKVELPEGQAREVGEGRILTADGVLQEGERRRSSFGPGVFLSLRDQAGHQRGSAFLSPLPGMRTRAILDGVSLTLDGLSEETAGRYDVHRDPGVTSVLAGTVLLGLGTLWALAGYLGMIPAGREGEMV